MNRATRRLMKREGLLCEHGHPKKTDGTGTPMCPHGCGFTKPGMVTHAELQEFDSNFNGGTA